MANNLNNIQNLKPFNKGYDKRRNVTGANRKSWAAFNLKCETEGIEHLTKKQFASTLNYIFNLTENEIEKIKNDVDQPYYLRLLLADFTDKKTGAKIRQDYRDYIFGKAKEEISHNIEQPAINGHDAIRALIAHYDNVNNDNGKK